MANLIDSETEVSEERVVIQHLEQIVRVFPVELCVLFAKLNWEDTNFR